MSKFTKYKLYQKYETRGSQEAIPCYPNVFSIDGDGTMPLVIVEENSRDCGYTGETQPIYRWYQMPIDTYYYCDACQDAQYKWVNLPISQDWECVGTTKYYKQKKQVSVDGGSTWSDVTPPQYQRGSVYEQNSQSCGYRTRTTTGSPYCEQYDKYVDVYSQVSSDGGNTWQTTTTTPTMVERNSSYCGYEPLSAKLRASYINGTSYSADCDSNTTLTSGDTRPNGYIYTAMTSAEIGDCITSIGDSVFSGCTSLTSVTIPDNVISIGMGAFHWCSGLTSIVIPDSVTSIGEVAFYFCTSLTSCTIGSGVTSIGASAFQWCSSLTSIDIPSGVTTIGESTFEGCRSLTSCTIGSGVTSIGTYAFDDCSGLTSIVIPDSVTSIGYGAFWCCSGLTSCTIGSGVTSIGESAFYRCSGLTSIVIPDNVTSIGGGAFYNSRSLTSCTIGRGVTSIGTYAFQNCRSLTSVTVLATTPPTLGNNYVFNNTNNCPIYVPAASVETYKSASGWSSYASRIQAIP